jgi:aryl-alcohol dehydrogenase-like predicted oxidoreductase
MRRHPGVQNRPAGAVGCAVKVYQDQPARSGRRHGQRTFAEPTVCGELRDAHPLGPLRQVHTAHARSYVRPLTPTRLLAVANPYSAVQREHEELISQAAATGAGTLIRGGAARGAPADDKQWKQGPIGLSEGEGQRRWEASGIDDLLGDMSRVEFVLRFTLSHPDLSSTIVGTSSLDHLRSNLEIAEKGPLPADLYDQARHRLGTVNP